MVGGRSTGVVGNCLVIAADEVEFVSCAAVTTGTVSGISSVFAAGTATGISGVQSIKLRILEHYSRAESAVTSL
jgi:hypothetical protein